MLVSLRLIGSVAMNVARLIRDSGPTTLITEGTISVEMILMFTLGREDVFAVDDLGIQQSVTKLYDLDPSNKKLMKQKMLEISEPWRPYRTYACRYLWGWKDGE